MISKRLYPAAAACLLGLASGPALAQSSAPAASASPPAAAAPAQAPAQAPGAAAAPVAVPPAGTPYRPITPSGDILSTLQASGEFKIFVKAIQATNLAQIVKTHPGLTVLAPPDSAFGAMPAAQLQALQKNIPELQKLVTYHLINTRITSEQVLGHAATAIPTVANVPVSFDGLNGKVTINGANVLQADVMASNGVIFVIDQVLNPAAPPPAPPAAPAEGAAAAPASGAPAPGGQ